VSPMPMDIPCCSSQWLTVTLRRSKNKKNIRLTTMLPESMSFCSVKPAHIPIVACLVSTHWMLLIRRRVASGPCSIQVTWTRPPPAVPSDFLHRHPVISSPRLMNTCTGGQAQTSQLSIIRLKANF
jgi:hypothetical protein